MLLKFPCWLTSFHLLYKNKTGTIGIIHTPNYSVVYEFRAYLAKHFGSHCSRNPGSGVGCRVKARTEGRRSLCSYWGLVRVRPLAALPRQARNFPERTGQTGSERGRVTRGSLWRFWLQGLMMEDFPALLPSLDLQVIVICSYLSSTYYVLGTGPSILRHPRDTA